MNAIDNLNATIEMVEREQISVSQEVRNLFADYESYSEKLDRKYGRWYETNALPGEKAALSRKFNKLFDAVNGDAQIIARLTQGA